MLTPKTAPRFALGALGLMLAALIITRMAGFSFSVAVMMLIATSGVLTIIALVMLGSTHGESPVAASDSNAVAIWNERVASRAQATANAETSDDTPEVDAENA